MRTDYFRNKLQHDNRDVKTIRKDMKESIEAFLLARELLANNEQNTTFTREQYADLLAVFILQSTFRLNIKQA